MKINPSRLESAPGLRIAIIPTQSGRNDAIRRDDTKNLVICPMPHDASFMQVFYEGWRIVQALCERDFRLPGDVDLPRPADREVALVYAERREFTVEEVLRATEKFAQPHLLEPRTEKVASESLESTVAPATSTVVSPFATEV